MNAEQIKEILVDQEKSHQPGRNLVEREISATAKDWFLDQQIVVISGIRRCGKSTLMHQLRQRFPGYFCNFDDDRFIPFTADDFQILYESLIELYGEQHLFYFDEIQNIVGWERFVRRLHDAGKKMIISGSNATMLSRELGSHLTGRYRQIDLYPFSFKEYLAFQNLSFKPPFTTPDKAMIKRHLHSYLLQGGMPEFLQIQRREYLKMLLENIIYRDVLVRYDLSNERAIQELIYMIAGNIGKTTSYSAVKKIIGVKNPTTVKDYFGYLENCFLVFLLPKFDFSIKRQIYTSKKPYFIDTGLARHFGFRASPDHGRMLENLVFIHLRRQNETLFYFQDKNECDFVSATQAVQVCYELTPQNRVREINGLEQASQKLDLKQTALLTFDQEEEFTLHGLKIDIRPVWKDLLQ